VEYWITPPAPVGRPPVDLLGYAEKVSHRVFVVNWSNVERFTNFFTGTLRSKFDINIPHAPRYFKRF